MLGTNFGFSEKISQQLDETDESEQAHSVVFEMPYGLEPDEYRKIKLQYEEEADRLKRKGYVPVIRTPYEWNFIEDDDDVNAYDQFASYINVALALGCQGAYIHIDWDVLGREKGRERYENLVKRFRGANSLSMVPFNKNTPDWLIDQINNELLTAFYIDISRMINENKYPYGDEVLNNTNSMIIDYEHVEDYYIDEEKRDKAIYKDSAKKAFSRVFDRVFDPYGNNEYMTIDADNVDEYNHAIKKMNEAGVFQYA